MAGKPRHGHARRPRSKTYMTWSAMIQRCLNRNNPCFPLYGGRGISVIGTWLKFENFLADMGESPAGMTLDRIDNEKGYRKENCRWVDHKTNSRNTRKVRMRRLFGLEKSLGEWCELFDINPKIVEARTRRGEDLYYALIRSPVRQPKETRK